MRVVVRHAERPLVHVQLADDHGAGPAKPLDDVRVAVGDTIREELRPRRRANARGIEQILERDRHPAERPDVIAAPPRVLDVVRGRQRLLGRDGDERVDLGVARRDALERGCDGVDDYT
jgi:hypothetical protein